MYNRISLELAHSPNNEGSKSLPSILKFNEITAKKADDNSSIKKAKVTAANLNSLYTTMAGGIGDNYNEFSVDFVSSDKMNNVVKYTKNVQDLYDLLTNDDNISVSKTELQKLFYVYEFNDYSYQAMSVNNYDYYPKLFINVRNETTNKLINKVKVISTAIVVIKSYTMKKAWLLLDRYVLSLFENYYTPYISNKSTSIFDFELLLDFNYKYFYDEISGNAFKYQSVSNGQNIQALFKNGTNVSPYFDRYYSDDSSVTNAVSRQSNYFKLALLDLFKDRGDKSNSLIAKDILNNMSLNIYKTVADSSSSMVTTKKLTPAEITAEISENIDNLRLTYKSKITEDVLKSAAYEVYEYNDAGIDPENNKNVYFGVRVFGENTLSDVKAYEIYPVPSDMLHYIFKCDKNELNNNNTLATNIKSYYEAYTKNPANNSNLIDLFHKILYCKELYQWNYDFKEVRPFFNECSNCNISTKDIYFELYIPFMESYPEVTVDLSNISDISENISLITSPELKDTRNPFDPTFNGQKPLEYISENSKYEMPIYGIDKNIRSLMKDNVYLSIVTLDEFTYTMDDIRTADVYDKYFNIRPAKATDVYCDDESDNIIDSTSVINKLSSAGFRNTANTGIDDFVKDVENIDNILSDNLFKLIPEGIFDSFIKVNYDTDDIKFSAALTKGDVPLCLVLKIEGLTFVEMKYRYTDNNGNLIAYVKIPKVAQSTITEKTSTGNNKTYGLFIIPCDLANNNFILSAVTPIIEKEFYYYSLY